MMAREFSTLRIRLSAGYGFCLIASDHVTSVKTKHRMPRWVEFENATEIECEAGGRPEKFIKRGIGINGLIFQIGADESRTDFGKDTESVGSGTSLDSHQELTDAVSGQLSFNEFVKLRYREAKIAWKDIVFRLERDAVGKSYRHPSVSLFFVFAQIRDL